jgi:hypothetical protein
MTKKELSNYFSRMGKKSAAARMQKLSPEERRRIGKHAIAARWAKAKKKKEKP